MRDKEGETEKEGKNGVTFTPKKDDCNSGADIVVFKNVRWKKNLYQ